MFSVSESYELYSRVNNSQKFHKCTFSSQKLRECLTWNLVHFLWDFQKCDRDEMLGMESKKKKKQMWKKIMSTKSAFSRIISVSVNWSTILMFQNVFFPVLTEFIVIAVSKPLLSSTVLTSTLSNSKICCCFAYEVRWVVMGTECIQWFWVEYLPQVIFYC